MQAERSAKALRAAEVQLEAEISRAENVRAMAQLNVDAARVAEQQALAAARRAREELKQTRVEMQHWQSEARSARRVGDTEAKPEAPAPPRQGPPLPREMAAVSPRSARATSRAPSPAPPRTEERQTGWTRLRSQSILGLALLVLILAVAILLVSGAVKLGFAP